MYADREVKVRKYAQHLGQPLAVMNDLACVKDFSPQGLLHSFEPEDKALLKTWKTGSPES